MLTGAGIRPDEWTAAELTSAMYATVTGRRWTAPERLTNPLGYLRFLLSTINPEDVARKRKAAADREARLASARAAQPALPQPEQVATNSRGAAMVRRFLLELKGEGVEQVSG